MKVSLTSTVTGQEESGTFVVHNSGHIVEQQLPKMTPFQGELLTMKTVSMLSGWFAQGNAVRAAKGAQ